MIIVLSFVGGLLAYHLWTRFAIRAFRHFWEGDRSERIRKDIFQGMKYDALLRVRTALDAEIAKRQP